MTFKRTNVLLYLFLVAIMLSFSACSDDGDGDDDGNNGDDDKNTPTCRDTPEAEECITPRVEPHHNTRRCPELEDHENLRYEENFQNYQNAVEMSRKFNKSYGEDTLINEGESQVITGRFWSGKTNLPQAGTGPDGEEMVIFRSVDPDNPDGEWEILAEAVTDDDGHFEVELPEEERFDRGRNRILSILKADGTCVEHGVFVYEEGFETILTDIDATLTTLDDEMLDQMIGDKGLDYIPKKLVDATTMTNAWTDKGYLMLYLSARPVDYLSWTRLWLREEGFPYGPSKGASNLVHGSTAAAYKQEYVEEILDKNGLNWQILYGYGNAFSDVDGYVDGGIPKENCFMVNEAGCPNTDTRNDKECTCTTESDESACQKFDDLQATPYKEQEGVGYRGVHEILNSDYKKHPETAGYTEHIEEHVEPHADAQNPL